MPILDAFVTLVILGVVVGLGVATMRAIGAIGAAPRKKELATHKRLLNDLEAYALDQLAVNPNDLTAHRVFGIIHNARQKELS